MTSEAAAPAMAPDDSARRRALVLLAVVAGVSVANLYYAQPLAASMAQSFQVSPSAFGLALMASQLGYALGMLLLVPLGDGRERRGLMLRTALAASALLLVVAAAPSFVVVATGSLLLGFASCLPQMALPFAVGLVAPERRGRAIGLVMGGLLTGILLSRTVSGALAAAIGWRATFASAAGLMVAVALTLRFALPRQEPEQPLAWGPILRSLAGVVRGQPLLRRHALVGACGFAAFSAFWSTLSFHLARLGHGSEMAGAFGIIGLSGVIAAPIVGRLVSRVPPPRINLLGHAAMALSFGVFAAAPSSLAAIALGVILLDVGVQASHLANQAIIFGLDPALRNRTNAVYMVAYFAGGSVGTLLASLAWQHHAWLGVCALGAAAALAGTLPVLLTRRPPREALVGRA